MDTPTLSTAIKSISGYLSTTVQKTVESGKMVAANLASSASQLDGSTARDAYATTRKLANECRQTLAQLPAAINVSGHVSSALRKLTYKKDDDLSDGDDADMPLRANGRYADGLYYTMQESGCPWQSRQVSAATAPPLVHVLARLQRWLPRNLVLSVTNAHALLAQSPKACADWMKGRGRGRGRGGAGKWLRNNIGNSLRILGMTKLMEQIPGLTVRSPSNTSSSRGNGKGKSKGKDGWERDTPPRTDASAGTGLYDTGMGTGTGAGAAGENGEEEEEEVEVYECGCSRCRGLVAVMDAAYELARHQLLLRTLRNRQEQLQTQDSNTKGGILTREEKEDEEEEKKSGRERIPDNGDGGNGEGKAETPTPALQPLNISTVDDESPANDSRPSGTWDQRNAAKDHAVWLGLVQMQTVGLRKRRGQTIEENGGG